VLHDRMAGGRSHLRSLQVRFGSSVRTGVAPPGVGRCRSRT
jgi:hypothetical protein